jgi:hypothetical protein
MIRETIAIESEGLPDLLKYGSSLMPMSPESRVPVFGDVGVAG